MGVKSNVVAVLLLFLYSVSVQGNKDDLQIETIEKPEKCKKMTKLNDVLQVHYTGTLESTGIQFDTSLGREAFEFQLGSGEVIKGWDQGLLNMCVGEKRVLTVPPNLAYGDKGAGESIPGGATLKFEIELMTISDAPKPNQIFGDIDQDHDGLLSQDEVEIFLAKQMGGGAHMEGDTGKSMMDNMVKEFIRIQDTNKDGVIAPREFAKPTHGPGHKDEL